MIAFLLNVFSQSYLMKFVLLDYTHLKKSNRTGAAPFTVLKYLEHCSRTVCNGNADTVLEQCLVIRYACNHALL